jgi:hypothetical protein
MDVYHALSNGCSLSERGDSGKDSGLPKDSKGDLGVSLSSSHDGRRKTAGEKRASLTLRADQVEFDSSFRGSDTASERSVLKREVEDSGLEL